MRPVKKRPPDPPTASRITEKLLAEKLGRARPESKSTPISQTNPEHQTKQAEEKAALLGLRIQQLALDKEQAEQERDKHASLADFGQQEFIAAERTAKQQTEEIVILKQKCEELDWKLKNAKEEFEQDEQRLQKENEALDEQLSELRASYRSTATEDTSFTATEVKGVKDQITKVRRERTTSQRELSDMAQMKSQEIDAVRDKISALQNRCRRDMNERDGQIGDSRQKIHEMALQLARKEAKMQELRSVLEERRRDRPLSKANKELADQVARMRGLGQQREAEARRLQDRLDVCEAALQDQKGELKSALSFLSAIREQAAEKGTKAQGAEADQALDLGAEVDA
jgi:myosin heavy subunit